MAYSELSKNQRKVLQAFLDAGNRKIEDVAEQAGLSERTVYRYLQDDNFRTELKNAQLAVLDRVTISLARLTEKALEGLEDVLDHPDQDGATNKRHASRTVLQLLTEYTDRDIEDRLIVLERMIFGEEKRSSTAT